MHIHQFISRLANVIYAISPDLWLNKDQDRLTTRNMHAPKLDDKEKFYFFILKITLDEV